MLWLRRLGVTLIVILMGPLISAANGTGKIRSDWYSASRESAGIAPDPKKITDPILQVYAARAFSWRGAFAVHTWIAIKDQNAEDYETHEVVGWGHHDDSGVLRSRTGVPDRYWYGAKPVLLTELKGQLAKKAIREVREAITTYPWPSSYQSWPGPNSNTFTAWLIRQSPSVKANLPPTAIGKDYLGPLTFIGSAPSGTGIQLSLWGSFGFLLSEVEGLEINIFGLSFGLNPFSRTLRLAGLGTISF